MKKLQREIESAREKLNDIVKSGYNEKKCYLLSLKLDKLIEYYIIIQEQKKEKQQYENENS